MNQNFAKAGMGTATVMMLMASLAVGHDASAQGHTVAVQSAVTTKAAPVTATVAKKKLVVVRTCPITGQKVVGAGFGMSTVDNYQVHFCCPNCKPEFDKLTKAQKLAKIHKVLKKA